MKMAVQDLFRQQQRSRQALSDDAQVLAKFGIGEVTALSSNLNNRFADDNCGNIVVVTFSSRLMGTFSASLGWVFECVANPLRHETWA